eukprot:gene5886-9714_t
MENIKTVDYLKKNGVEKLKETFLLNVYKHENYSNLVQFSYNQTLSDFSNEIVQECRGIVLDVKNDFKIISYPFDKFFNFGEKQVKEIDIKKSKIYEKHDGSMAILYFYDKKWHVGSTSRCDGSSHMCFVNENEKVIPFRQLFWEIFDALKYDLPNDTNLCYVFEMITYRHGLVVKHKKEDLILLGARDLTTLEELDPVEVVKKLNWKSIIPLEISVKSLDELKEMACKLDPTICEGYVVCDENFNRVKIKSPQYVLLSHLMFDDENSKNNQLLKILYTNEGSEFLVYFPKFKKEYDELMVRFDIICASILKIYEKHKGVHESPLLLSQKDFALDIKKANYPKYLQDILFQLRKDFDIKIIVKQLRYSTFENLMKNYKNE